jgi:hypothetical protein
LADASSALACNNLQRRISSILHTWQCGASKHTANPRCMSSPLTSQTQRRSPRQAHSRLLSYLSASGAWLQSRWGLRILLLLVLCGSTSVFLLRLSAHRQPETLNGFWATSSSRCVQEQAWSVTSVHCMASCRHSSCVLSAARVTYRLDLLMWVEKLHAALGSLQRRLPALVSCL